MIHYTQGDILQAKVDVLVNPVNCVGVMGKGLALQFKHAYPANYDSYRQACELLALKPGTVHVSKTGTQDPKWIINFPTKRHWKDLSRLEDIETGLMSMKMILSKLDVKSIAIPALGAGLGGLSWSVVRAKIESALEDSNLEIHIYEPF